MKVPREVTPRGDVAQALTGCTLRLPRGDDINNADVENALWALTPDVWLDNPDLNLPVMPFRREQSNGVSYLNVSLGALQGWQSYYDPAEGLRIVREGPM